MAAASSAAGAAPVTAGSRRDAVWLLTLWVVLSIIGCLLVALVLGPHMPPGRASQQASSQATDLTVLATEKVTRKSLDEADQRRLVEEALSELDFEALAGGRE